MLTTSLLLNNLMPFLSVLVEEVETLQPLGKKGVA